MAKYIIMCASKERRFSDRFEPLSYGRGDEIGQKLLLKRGRATIFNSIDDAKKSLKETLIDADKNDCAWHKSHVFDFIEVE